MYKLLIIVRSRVLVYLTHNLALPFLKLVRKPLLFPYVETELGQMQNGTLGKDLYLFLAKRKLHLLPYYAKHDIKHILLDYDTTDEGEVCLQCFMLGNGHVSFPVVATVLFGVLTMPEYWHKFKTSFKRGAASVKLKDWKWFDIMEERTTSLQLKINGQD